jgi:hypothetical protein
VTIRRATITDVAASAGVSVATASKALTGRVDVRETTGQRVPDAVAQLTFPPNALAQGLLPGQTRTVGLLAGDMAGRFGIPCYSARKRFRGRQDGGAAPRRPRRRGSHDQRLPAKQVWCRGQGRRWPGRRRDAPAASIELFS